ncbi:hypothetical protein CN233_13455 [Sinorhizobium meliloti]|nr:hypothetical protein BWO76_09700 [Sinorhizobium meliloti]ATA96654.1 hypothetical protein BWO76_09815 [Sinorhizobium meliloti]RVG32712.1 hypothetical protein CN233_13455 [Sinorhizobium meliloti]
MSFALEQACATNGRRCKFPKYLGLPGRFRHAFIPQAHTRRYITDVELLTGLGVAAFILAISVLVGHEV